MSGCAVVVLEPCLMKDLPEGDLFGVEKGALFLAENNCRMKYAIGDFDSVSEESLVRIQKSAEQMVRLNPIKNDSDSEAAVTFALQKGYDHVMMLGGLGGRSDHTYVNLMLAYRFGGRLTIQNSQNKVTAREKGRYSLVKDGYPYISFFAPEKAVITLSGVFYPLKEKTIVLDDLYPLSNEITAPDAFLEVHAGKVLVIQAKDA